MVESYNWGLVCQSQVSRARNISYTPKILGKNYLPPFVDTCFWHTRTHFIQYQWGDSEKYDKIFTWIKLWYDQNQTKHITTMSILGGILHIFHGHRHTANRRRCFTNVFEFYNIQWTILLYSINSFCPGDAIRRHGTRSTLAQVMACCLTAPSHYLNQCWLIIGDVP